MGCNYEYPDGECTDEPPTTEPPTTEPEDPPSSEEVAILEQQVEDLTVNKIPRLLSIETLLIFKQYRHIHQNYLEI